MYVGGRVCVFCSDYLMCVHAVQRCTPIRRDRERECVCVCVWGWTLSAGTLVSVECCHRTAPWKCHDCTNYWESVKALTRTTTTHTSVSEPTHTHTHTHTRTHTHAHGHTHTHTRTHARTHTRTHTHEHFQLILKKYSGLSFLHHHLWLLSVFSKINLDFSPSVYKETKQNKTKQKQTNKQTKVTFSVIKCKVMG